MFDANGAETVSVVDDEEWSVCVVVNRCDFLSRDSSISSNDFTVSKVGLFDNVDDVIKPLIKTVEEIHDKVLSLT